MNEDHGYLAGASPGLFIGVQLIHPGETVPNHRHNSVAIYHTLQGEGITTVEGVEYPYKRGDTIVSAGVHKVQAGKRVVAAAPDPVAEGQARREDSAEAGEGT